MTWSAGKCANHDELTAVQHAMNLRLQDEAAVFAEYQNEPLPAEVVDADELTADQIASKLNRMKRYEMPIGCHHVTMFIDVQQALLFYLVAAWEDDFTGYVIDYGALPDQRRPYFTLRDARLTLAAATQAAGLEGSIYADLEALSKDYFGRDWRRHDGAVLRVKHCLIDANWGSSTDVVYQFCRQSRRAGIVMPSHGRFVNPSSQPFSNIQAEARRPRPARAFAALPRTRRPDTSGTYAFRGSVGSRGAIGDRALRGTRELRTHHVIPVAYGCR